MADDVARFLQMVNERRAQEQARQAQARQAQALQAQALQAQAAQRQAHASQPAPGRPVPRRAVAAPATRRPPADIEIIEAESLETPARVEHLVGTIAPQAPMATPPGRSMDQPPGGHQTAQSWAGLLRSPASLRQAILLAEILRRPEW